MTFLIALALGIVLAHRLGAFQPWQQYHHELSFKSEVFLLAEDLEWEERMARRRRQLAAHVRRVPFITVR